MSFLELQEGVVEGYERLLFSPSGTNGATWAVGNHLLNSGWSKYLISDARQIVRLRLDEQGAALKTDGVIIYSNGERHFQFDKPFLIYLKERSSDVPDSGISGGQEEFQPRFHR